MIRNMHRDPGHEWHERRNAVANTAVTAALMTPNGFLEKGTTLIGIQCTVDHRRFCQEKGCVVYCCREVAREAGCM